MTTYEDKLDHMINKLEDVIGEFVSEAVADIKIEGYPIHLFDDEMINDIYEVMLKQIYVYSKAVL